MPESTAGYYQVVGRLKLKVFAMNQSQALAAFKDMVAKARVAGFVVECNEHETFTIRPAENNG